MDLICVGHAIKEVLSAQESLAALEQGARQSGTIISGSFLISDGGDGFLEVYGNSHDTITDNVLTIDALGASHHAPTLWDEENKTAVIEIAQCIGLAQVDPSRRNIMISGSAGVADLIIAARSKGANKVIIGLGGSATCDGGVGLLWRLAELSGQCRNGCPEIRTALDMADIPSPDIVALQDWLNVMEIEVCVDVDNPLLGAIGAAHAFAAQKGASSIEVDQLEAFMAEWAERVERNGGDIWREVPGAGAAGGLGFALAVVGAKLIPGALASAAFTGLTGAIARGFKVFTTEGRFDATSFNGKAPWTVAEIALEQGADPAIFCGMADNDAVSRAQKQGVAIIEYGRDIDPMELKNETSGQISNVVANYLKSRAGATA